MIENEETQNNTPFFSISSMRGKKYEIFLPNEESEEIPYGVINLTVEEREDKEVFEIKMSIEDWTVHFIKLLGYTGKVNKESITYSMDEKRKFRIEGSFGSLIIDEKSNLQYETAESTP